MLMCLTPSAAVLSIASKMVNFWRCRNGREGPSEFFRVRGLRGVRGADGGQKREKARKRNDFIVQGNRSM